ncbi:hypothetical protein FA13DRAFT_1757975 [Coprinellus micaceus]|uniref:Glycosyltransferase family 61 protein n=1 Tax=Coprinellus micaceus TaxID=71717 RepID=A0A4Y7SE51_COPMI|nr:hypothetical protein FA13DRAFT_1757975 [Coprinellus micaceus]
MCPSKSPVSHPASFLLPALTILSTVNQQVNHVLAETATVTTTATARTTITATTTRTTTETQTAKSPEGWSYDEVDKLAGVVSPRDKLLPPTSLLAHAPGWTLFRNLYMYNNTLYINSRDRKPDYYGPHGEDLTYGYTKAGDWPEIRRMTSSGGSAVNSPENIAEREPRPQHMQFISTKEARRRWGNLEAQEKQTTVMVAQGNSLLFNDPSQFLRHYYHFVAELFFGVQAFWNSAFNPTLTNSESTLAAHFGTAQATNPPPIHRAIFIHSNADGWHDNPGFNRYFLRAAYPSLTVEHEEDWQDRVKATIEGVAPGTSPERVWRFPLALLTDRSASHRGVICGSQTQRTAAEAWDHMRKVGKLRGIHVGGWWAPVREAIWKFAGVNPKEGGVVDGEQVALVVQRDGKLKENDPHLAHAHAVAPLAIDVGDEYQAALPMPTEVVITYISRQSARNRKLLKEDHQLLVESMEDLVKRKNTEREVLVTKNKRLGTKKAEVPPPWSFDLLEAEHLSKDEQVRAAARTTILLGVHGNGLSSLIWMKPTRVSSVIEIFCPPGFAHDYWWTTRSLGMRHWAMWNDTSKTWPEKPEVSYPECFQRDEIPIHGPAVAKLIEDRVDGKL